MSVYLITFEGGRIGRHRGIRPARVQADGLGGVAEAVYALACPHLIPICPEVLIDLREDEESPTCLIFAGPETVGRFTIEEIAA